MHIGDWVHCIKNEGRRHDKIGEVSHRVRQFNTNAIGKIKELSEKTASVWLIGLDEIWEVPLSSINKIEVEKTGDKFKKKICNICHCLLPVNDFDKNQTNAEGEKVRRPSCRRCRTDIDKRAPKSQQAKQFEKTRPKKGDAFRCPICDKRSIVGVTAKIVADHNHHTGDIRDFICDSCNTGLGRFRNGENYLYNAIKYLEERES